MSVGFFNTGTPPTGEAFFAGSRGLATSLTRRANSTDYFGGPGVGSPFNVIDGTGTRTFTTILDLTPAGGYNGTDNFGTVTFRSDNDGGTPTSFTYTTQQTFASLGFTFNSSADSQLSNFRLEQVPEPSSALLGAVGAFALLRRRR